MYHREARQRCDRWHSSSMAANSTAPPLPARRRAGAPSDANAIDNLFQQEVSDTFNWVSSRRISALAHSDSARLLNGEAAPSAKPL